MDISVLTPDQEVFEGKIDSVKVPGVQGEFQVLENHAPIVSALQEGQVTIITSAGEHRYYDEESGSIQTDNQAGKAVSFHIQSGFLEVLKNEVSLLVQGVKMKRNN